MSRIETFLVSESAQIAMSGWGTALIFTVLVALLARWWSDRRRVKRALVTARIAIRNELMFLSYAHWQLRHPDLQPKYAHAAMTELFPVWGPTILERFPEHAADIVRLHVTATRVQAKLDRGEYLQEVGGEEIFDFQAMASRLNSALALGIRDDLVERYSVLAFDIA